MRVQTMMPLSRV